MRPPRLAVRRRRTRRSGALAACGGRGAHGAEHALYDATRYLRDAGTGRRALVLITDGHDEDSAVELADGLAVAQQAGIPVFTIGVGGVEERVMRRVAKLTGGQYTPLARTRPGMVAAPRFLRGVPSAAPPRRARARATRSGR